MVVQKTNIQSKEAEIRRQISELVIELAPNPDVTLSTQTLLSDELGYHSIVMIELAVALEREFQLEPLPPTEARGIRTVGHLQDAVVRQIMARK